ncbi:NB-ARC domains-containing protein [Tanacetum coccineum]
MSPGKHPSPVLLFLVVFFADTNMRVLVDKSLITISSKKSLQMHDLTQAMAKEIVREDSIFPGKQRRLCISSEVYDGLSNKKLHVLAFPGRNN